MSKKETLIKTVKKGLKQGAKMLVLTIVTPANSKEATLVKGEEDILKKLAYIEGAYDDNLVHLNNDKVFIHSGAMHTNDYGLL